MIRNFFSLLIFFGLIIFLTIGCSKKNEIYTVGICEFTEDPSSKDAEQGFIKAFTDAGIITDKDIRFKILNAQGDFSSISLIADKFVNDKVDMLCCLATPCLQACINTETKIPILFSRIANPFLAGAGNNPQDHLINITGVATTSPFTETIVLIKKLMPDVKVVGTVWSPSELNSEYYTKLQKEAAEKAGLTIIAVPIHSSSEMNIAVFSLINRNIDCIYQISDNLTSIGFEAEVKAANDNKIPIFCNQINEVERGAAMGLGWSYFDAGYEAGKLAVQVKNGESPGNIPIQFMKRTELHINLNSAEKQGLIIPDEIVKSADKIFK
ncbi:MAG: ABC transporter substrate-binding protein [Candidatus Cloacimonetes bacterium]|nr:ABC transporter substrate-binding protein [Candidatus Cloacimonadota bacterium]